MPLRVREGSLTDGWGVGRPSTWSLGIAYILYGIPIGRINYQLYKN